MSMPAILGPIVTFCQVPKVPTDGRTLAAMAINPTERELFASRLIELCNAAGYPEHGRQTRLAKQFGLTAKAARKWVMGIGLPELDVIIAMAKWGDVNVEWLLTGRGPKRGDLVDTKALQLGEMMRSLPAVTRHEVVEYLGYKIERGVPTLAQQDRTRYLELLAAFKNGPA